jgi:hypothetical protein
MREFFVLTYDDRDDLQSVSDYDMGGFDLTVFWSGKPFVGTIPDSVKLFVGKGEPSDYLANPISWAITSGRFLEQIARLVRSDMQVFPAPLYDEESLKPLLDHSIVNVTRCLDALAKPLISVDQMILTRASIPSDAHLFRVVGHETLLVASKELFNELGGKKLQGLAFIKTKCV